MDTETESTTVAAVLLIPAIGDPLGLLKPGPCDARAPTVCRWGCDACRRVLWMTWNPLRTRDHLLCGCNSRAVLLDPSGNMLDFAALQAEWRPPDRTIVCGGDSCVG